jgi:hypothetical protein
MRRVLKTAAVVAGVAGAVALAVTHLNCAPVPAFAPPGTSLTMFVNPKNIAPHGGESQITVLLLEKTGAPVADGTVVQFFTTLGHIPEQGRSNDGIVRVNLVADGRRGTATVTAISGGGGSSGSTTSTGDAGVRALGPAPTTAPTAAPTTPPSTGGSSIGQSAFDTVLIGVPTGGKIIMSASPPQITGGGTSLITATVIDGDGNPIPNLAVFFSVSESSKGEERLTSRGNPVFTDNNGRAEDVLRGTGSQSYTATITASVGGGIADGTVDVVKNP